MLEIARFVVQFARSGRVSGALRTLYSKIVTGTVHSPQFRENGVRARESVMGKVAIRCRARCPRRPHLAKAARSNVTASPAPCVSVTNRNPVPDSNVQGPCATANGVFAADSSG